MSTLGRARRRRPYNKQFQKTMKKDLTKDILGKIQKGVVKQTPKWVFVLKYAAWWLLFAFALLCGAIASSIIFLMIFEINLEILPKFALGHLFNQMFRMLFWWLLSLGILIAIAFFGARRTRKGYKIPWFKMIAINLIFSLLGGLGIFAFGGAHRLEKRLVPRMTEQHMKLVHQPENGVIAGQVQSLTGNTLLILFAPDEITWRVDITDVPERQLNRLLLVLENEHKPNLKIMGEKDDTEEQAFIAEKFLPPRKMNKKQEREIEERLNDPARQKRHEEMRER